MPCFKRLSGQFSRLIFILGLMALVCACASASQSRWSEAKPSPPARASLAPKGLPLPGQILRTAFAQIGVPYRYGGNSPETGFDCSGFVKWVYGQFGFKLPRISREMMSLGRPVERENLRPGDLVFFGKGKRITHVGIYTGQGMYIHSPRCGKPVQENDLDHRGGGEYYAAARRLISESQFRNAGPSEEKRWLLQARRSALSRQTSLASLMGPLDGSAPPAPKAKAQAPAPAKPKKHKVAAGDTFYGVARKYKVKPAALAQANNLKTERQRSLLKPGQILIIPSRL